MKGLILKDDRSSDYEETVLRDEFLRQCERSGLVIREPEANEIFVDLDTEEDYEEFIRRLERIDGYIEGFKVTPSKSGLPHRHVILKTYAEQLTNWERVALQFALNSDPLREFLTVARLLADEERPIILFEKGDGA